MYVRLLSDPSAEVAEWGGKGASLAGLIAAGFPVPDGFCVTAQAYRAYREAGRMPSEVAEAIMSAYAALGQPAVAVRSSATSEDLVTASAPGSRRATSTSVASSCWLRSATAGTHCTVSGR